MTRPGTDLRGSVGRHSDEHQGRVVTTSPGLTYRASGRTWLRSSHSPNQPKPGRVPVLDCRETVHLDCREMVHLEDSALRKSLQGDSAQCLACVAATCCCGCTDRWRLGPPRTSPSTTPPCGGDDLCWPHNWMLDVLALVSSLDGNREQWVWIHGTAFEVIHEPMLCLGKVQPCMQHLHTEVPHARLFMGRASDLNQRWGVGAQLLP